MRPLFWIVAAAIVVASCDGSSPPSSPNPTPADNLAVTTAPTTTAPPVAGIPAPRRSHAMVSTGPGELLVVGGQTIAGNSSAWLGDTWVYSTQAGTWSQLGSVSVRGHHAVASSGTAAYLFGGYAGTDFVYGDFHKLGPPEWIPLDLPSLPSPRTGAVMAYDVESQLFVLYGGDEEPFDARLPTSETWVFDEFAGQWQQRDPAPAPSSRSEGHPTLFEMAVAYDERADRILLLIGGDELWAYDTNTDTWEPRTAPGLDSDFMVAAAYHAGLERLITYGGAPTGETQETWSYDYATDSWQRIATQTSPGPLADHAMAYDATTDLIYMYGGAAEVLSQGPPPIPSGTMWTFDGSDWTALGAPSP